jgi:hypothetical protein
MAYVRGRAHPYNMGLGSVSAVLPTPQVVSDVTEAVRARPALGAWFIGALAVGYFLIARGPKRGRRR